MNTDDTHTAQPAQTIRSRTRIDDAADYLTRAIFLAGYGPDGDKTQRIVFKGGRYGVAETDLGGFCQSALEEWIWKAMKARPDLFQDTPAEGE